MALTATEVTVAGTGHIWLAPVGTTLPEEGDDPTEALDAAFAEMGYTAEDGVTLTGEPEIAAFNAWQSTTAIRRSRKLQVMKIAADLLQWNPDTLKAAFGGGTVTGNTYRFPAAGDALAEYSAVVDWQDGDRNSRLVVPRMNSGLEAVSTQLNKDNMAVLPIALESLAATVTPFITFDDPDAFPDT